MNQIIKPESVDFNELVSNNTNKISINYQSKMIDILNKEFTEEQARWYIASLFMFINYHPTNEFPINLQILVELAGFSHKRNAKRTLENNFILDIDYKIVLLPKEGNSKSTIGRPEEKIMLNTDTFKSMCMLVKTEKSKDIRLYYVKLENIYNKIVMEEMETTQKLLKEKEKILEKKNRDIDQLKNKPELEGFIRKNGYIYIVTDTILTIVKNTGHIKLGSCGEDKINTRLSQLNVGSSTSSLKLLKKFKTFDVKFVEEMIHSALSPLKIRNRKEWFYFSNKSELDYVIDTIEKCIEFTNQFNVKDLRDFERRTSLLKNVVLNLNFDLTTNEAKDIKDVVEIEKVVEIAEVNENIKNANYRGLTWTKSKNKWKSSLTYKKKNYHLGYFIDQTDAAKMYNDYACYVNEKFKDQLKKSYELNDIENYIPNPRDIPSENKTINQNNKTSKYYGVHYVQSRKCYSSSISVDGNSINISSGKTEIEAAKIYNQQALFYNNTKKTNYVLNEIDGYITEAKDIKSENINIKNFKKTSKYVGVLWDKNISRWKALVVYKKNTLYLGLHYNEIEAAKAYNQQVLYINNNNKTKYKLNNIPNYETEPRNIYNEKYKDKLIDF